MAKLKVVWTNSAKEKLKSIYNYYKYEKQSLQAAKKIKSDILKASKEIIFYTQYQKDEIQPEYRRIIVGNYKLLYTQKAGTIYVVMVFSTFQNPAEQLYS